MSRVQLIFEARRVRFTLLIHRERTIGHQSFSRWHTPKKIPFAFLIRYYVTVWSLRFFSLSPKRWYWKLKNEQNVSDLKVHQVKVNRWALIEAIFSFKKLFNCDISELIEKMKTASLCVIVLVITVFAQSAQSQFSPKSFKQEASTRTNALISEYLVRNYENLTSIGDILELFSVDVIGSQWTTIHKRLTTTCAQNMMEYLSGLERKEVWAIKSELCLSAVVLQTVREWKRNVKRYRNFTFSSCQEGEETKRKEMRKKISDLVNLASKYEVHGFTKKNRLNLI